MPSSGLHDAAVNIGNGEGELPRKSDNVEDLPMKINRNPSAFQA
jgi:hypothetical protein